jgi:hypothetical protein
VSSSSVPKAATPPVERAAPRVMEQNIDSSIMKEMSKWDVVKTIKHKVKQGSTTPDTCDTLCVFDDFVSIDDSAGT